MGVSIFIESDLALLMPVDVIFFEQDDKTAVAITANDNNLVRSGLGFLIINTQSVLHFYLEKNVPDSLFIGNPKNAPIRPI
jgi:hypothetical protein